MSEDSDLSTHHSPSLVGVLATDEVLCSCYEIIKDVLLLFKDSLFVPVVPVFTGGVCVQGGIYGHTK